MDLSKVPHQVEHARRIRPAARFVAQRAAEGSFERPMHVERVNGSQRREPLVVLAVVDGGVAKDFRAEGEMAVEVVERAEP